MTHKTKESRRKWKLQGMKVLALEKYRENDQNEQRTMEKIFFSLTSFREYKRWKQILRESRHFKGVY